MFDGRGDDVVARPAANSKDGQIVGFRAAAGKHDLRGAAAEQRGHRFASALDRGPRLLPVMMDGGRVAEVLAKVGRMASNTSGSTGRVDPARRVVIEINAVASCICSFLLYRCRRYSAG
jgi:hypothetical protein